VFFGSQIPIPNSMFKKKMYVKKKIGNPGNAWFRIGICDPKNT
jgi:hypothetical protein